MNEPILEAVMNRRTLKRLPTLEGARCHGPVFGVPGVFSPLTSDALGLWHRRHSTRTQFSSEIESYPKDKKLHGLQKGRVG